MLKRLTLIGLVAVLAGLLVGCSGGESTAAPAGSDPAKQIDSTATPTLPPPTSSVGGQGAQASPQ